MTTDAKATISYDLLAALWEVVGCAERYLEYGDNTHRNQLDLAIQKANKEHPYWRAEHGRAEEEVPGS